MAKNVIGTVDGRLWLAAGLGLTVLGIVLYAVQLWLRHLWTPWYVPGLATLGVLCVGVAISQKPSLWRILALVLVVLLAGVEWAFLFMTRLPAYAGPVAEESFPAFTTLRADGTSFTQRDLQGPQNNVLVFFRGRW